MTEDQWRARRMAVERALRVIHPERRLCNCYQAYAGDDGGCPHGCSSNQLQAKDEIALAFLASLPPSP